jgi:hypothetical protein
MPIHDYPRLARHALGEIAAGREEHHLDRDQQGQRREHGGQYSAVDLRGNPRAEQCADQHEDGPALHNLDIDGIAPVMCPCRGNRGRNDRGERGADGDVHADRRIHPQESEYRLQHRHYDDAAADAEQSRKHARDAARR